VGGYGKGGEGDMREKGGRSESRERRAGDAGEGKESGENKGTKWTEGKKRNVAELQKRGGE